MNKSISRIGFGILFNTNDITERKKYITVVNPSFATLNKVEIAPKIAANTIYYFLDVAIAIKITINKKNTNIDTTMLFVTKVQNTCNTGTAVIDHPDPVPNNAVHAAAPAYETSD